MFRFSAGRVATTGNSPPVLHTLNDVLSGKVIAAVGPISFGGGGLGVGDGVGDAVAVGVGVGDWAEATEITMQLRLTRNASPARRGGIFTKSI
jgi:hypothetical protein